MMDPSDLRNLHDITEPAAVSLWPLAPGWWFLIVVGTAAGLVLLVKWYTRRKQTAYRRAALAELHVATTTAEVAAIIKRTALVGCGRTEVASLTGADWVQWLQHSTDQELEQQVADDLTTAIYQGNQPPNEALLRFASVWIQTHHDPTSRLQASSC